MADEFGKLLKYIVDQRVMHNEREVSEIDATAVQDVDAEVSGIAQDTHEAAQRLAPAFEQGLRLAAQAGGALSVDDTDRRGNDIADAFARFLVTTGLASSQSTPIGDDHYRYTFTLNWPQLRTLAQSAGFNLDNALGTPANPSQQGQQ